MYVMYTTLHILEKGGHMVCGKLAGPKSCQVKLYRMKHIKDILHKKPVIKIKGEEK